MLPPEGRSGSRRRGLLRRRWPWLLVAAAAALGGVTTGVSGVLVLGGAATALYAASSARVNAGWTSRPGRVVLLGVTGVVVGTAAMVLGGYLYSGGPRWTR